MPAHYFFRITGPLPKTIKFQFDEGQEVRSVTIIELRANGCQTMVPPSIHPDGSVLRWWGDPQTPGEPTTITGAELRAWAAQTAGAALLGRYWPAKGRRDAVARFVEAAALAAGDEE